MMYNVYSWVPVKVAIKNVEANSPEEACQKVCDNHLNEAADLIQPRPKRPDHGPTAAYISSVQMAEDENPLHHLVDQISDCGDIENSVWKWSDGKTPLAYPAFHLELLIQRLMGVCIARPRELLPEDRIWTRGTCFAGWADQRIFKALINEFKEEMPTLLGLDKDLDAEISLHLKQ